MQGQVREPGPSQRYEEAPLWMRTVMNNAQAFSDFYLDMAKSVQRCEQMIAEFLDKGEPDKAQKMLGKREALLEMRHILEAYRKEEEKK